MHTIPDIKTIVRYGLLALAASGLTLTVWSCTELGDDDGPHPDNWEDEHSASLRASGFNLGSCQGCHGQDLTGTDEVGGCSDGDCHTAPKGVYACDNCHGYQDSEPWENVAGDVSTDTVSVGMHTRHLSANGMTDNVTCSACHTLPQSTDIMGHIDGTYAEVKWSGLAVPTHDGATQPAVWDRSAATCANIYCHGNFYYFPGITGNDTTWSWVTPGAGDLCGACHNLPPPIHSWGTDQKCGADRCHTRVADPSSNIIIGLDRHINGAKDF
ncbi:MAG: CxxxxCH/CxxCH domain-containing protein [Candidatus Marinimicrobia bacterium]|nr:CxxxxCH/CxxCH domain-containing protein [Candidatus Neomarinimicrobiota bacterium]